jgi:hypothetical protein
MTWHQILAVVGVGLFIPGAGFFLVGWYHGWWMMMCRNGDWRGYYLAWGFLVDATLTEEGRRHRRKAAIYLVIAAPFLLGFVLISQFLNS